ncbi:MAG: TonB-dependent receptor family protein [Chitinophagaceae bacterium]
MKLIQTIAWISTSFLFGNAMAQQQAIDTLEQDPKKVIDVTVVGRKSRSDIHQLPEIVGTDIMAGKKNSLVVMDNVNGNIVTNNMRQVLAKVPGIHIWESDGSGIQIGIAARGLSPNRSWEFNTRQNGYDISSDPFGYPEAYYTPQLQSVQRIQIVRGAGALQYGPQFGGLVNFILRNGSDIQKSFQFETQNTVGSFGLVNTYNAVGGNTNKIHYYAFYDQRNADGWRENSRYKVKTGFASFNYQATNKLKLGFEYTNFYMISQQPGGLTDAQFNNNARQSFRSRNWFNNVWNIGTVTADYQFNNNTLLQIKAFGMWAERNSIGFTQNVLIADTINAATRQYNNRVVDVDNYKNYGMEARFITQFNVGAWSNNVSTGVRYFNGSTYRYRNGRGDVGNNFNLTLLSPYTQDLDLTTSNVAVFVENMFSYRQLRIIPGVRFETIGNTVGGQINVTNGNIVPVITQSKKRTFLLAGIGAEYHIKYTELYANISEAYRPALFSDLTGTPTLDVIDQNLKDAKGYNADLGYRGKVKDYLFFDIGIFYLQYNNRIGTLAMQDANGNFYNFRTNVGNSVSKGTEFLIEFNPVRAFVKNTTWGSVGVFVSGTYTDARYNNFSTSSRQGNSIVKTDFNNKRVENAPQWIVRSGINYYYKGLTITTQWSYVSSAFSDATNTLTPTANGQNGLIPSYHVADMSATYKFLEKFNIKAGINNATDARYFTRRAGGYPGPGLLPADARNVYISVGAIL